MTINIRSVRLHSTIFVGGRNLSDKIAAKPDLILEYDRKEKELHVTFQGETAIVPSTNINSMVLQIEADTIRSEPRVEIPFSTKTTAQIDSPMAHVFAGPGAGKTGKEK